MVKVARSRSGSSQNDQNRRDQNRQEERPFATRRTQDICGLILLFSGIGGLISLSMRQNHLIPDLVNTTLRLLAGSGAFVIPILLMFVGTMFLIGFEYLSFSHASLGSLLLFLDFITWRHLELVRNMESRSLPPPQASAEIISRLPDAGGWGGWLWGTPLHYLLGPALSYLFLTLVLMISLVLIVDRPIIEIVGRVRESIQHGMERSREHAEEAERLREAEAQQRSATNRRGIGGDESNGGTRLLSKVQNDFVATSRSDEGDVEARLPEEDRRRVEAVVERALGARRGESSEEGRDGARRGEGAAKTSPHRNLFDITRLWRGSHKNDDSSDISLEGSLDGSSDQFFVDNSDDVKSSDGLRPPMQRDSDGTEAWANSNDDDVVSVEPTVAPRPQRRTGGRTPRQERAPQLPGFGANGDTDGNSSLSSEVSTPNLLGTTAEGAPPEAVPEFVLPPLTLLSPPSPASKRSQSELTDNVSTIEKTLEQFNIDANVVEVASGPSVTRYEIQLGPGIKVSKIVNLADNLAMSLAAIDVRVEAPIPGKSAIGVEVPNATPVMVTLRECLETEEFKSAASKLTIALGKDVSGTYRYADLTRMPHLLIGGSTNSGKSVCLNVLIASLVYRNTPRDVRLLMIDPKRVELSLWDGIPHLMHPVVKDVRQASGIFRAALREMDRRYDLFATLGTRNIDGYNQKVPDSERLPYLVLIVDELADLMMQQGPEVEQSICRLAQLARATGIHLVIATQRPSVDIITGTIKANISSRIAFAVASQVDSRTILDMTGADRLIGRGDMLFLPIDASKPIRIQGCYLSENETNAIVTFLKEQEKPVFTFSVAEMKEASGNMSSANDDEEDGDEQIFEQAVRLVVNNGQASTSMLQRRFRIGYTRAARIVELMEERGIVGPLNGAKPRELLVSRDEVERMFRPGGPIPSVENYHDEGDD